MNPTPSWCAPHGEAHTATRWTASLTENIHAVGGASGRLEPAKCVPAAGFAAVDETMGVMGPM